MPKTEKPGEATWDGSRRETHRRRAGRDAGAE